MMSTLLSLVCPLESEATIYETASTKDHYTPSQSTQAFQVFYGDMPPDMYGKWMVFETYDKIDRTWEKIRTAIARGELPGCNAKSTTKRYDPSKEGPGPSTSAVICVYTDKRSVDDIGFRLIEIVKRDIMFKTDEDSRNYKVTFAGTYKGDKRKIFWNKGRPSFKQDASDRSRPPRTRDIWHLNEVRAPEPLRSKQIRGRWVLELENKELTGLWHHLKGLIESEEKNFGIVKMVCPPKKERNSRTEKGKFEISTSNKDSRIVGQKLIELVKRNIKYSVIEDGRAKGAEETLFWNDGYPDYEIKGKKRN